MQNRWRKRGLAVTPTKFGIAFTKLTYNQGGALVHVYTDGTVCAHGRPTAPDPSRCKSSVNFTHTILHTLLHSCLNALISMRTRGNAVVGI